MLCAWRLNTVASCVSKSTINNHAGRDTATA
jgi:hypothetical protein